ncbi:nucleotidyltransferase/DNA polymerase involved in DNA repair [Natronobacillus azotifigens]|uniref:DNA polymerase IV n=1 Tax=Natronobacillus azotifigens TaxID=472978 RepID=A0A9J6RFQ7_9BACI|nr:DNA polymerase IV [Natronobacillus azotifigens]
MDRVIFLVDMQSFYASIEKVRNPAFRDKPVIVAGDPEQRSGIVLAACPSAKRAGVKTAEALWQAQAKCPEAVIVRPSMQLYVDVSYQITKILEQFSDQVEVYSIDEQFIDVTGSIRLFGEPLLLARKIHQAILETTGLQARVGIGPNKVLAKMACDAFAKKESSGIAFLDEENIKEKLWPLPIKTLFGVGNRMNAHLIKMGLHTIGNLANYPVKGLKKRWGINGEVLWRTANGIDQSPVVPGTHQRQKAIGHHMTLPRDYSFFSEIKVVLSELSEEVARRVRRNNYFGQTVSVYLQGNNFEVRTGFSKQIKLVTPTQLGSDIFQAALTLTEKNWDGNPVRSVGITLSQLQIADSQQLSLFDDPIPREKLTKVLDDLHGKYGPTAVIRASSLFDAGQAYVRSGKIGGHSR